MKNMIKRIAFGSGCVLAIAVMVLLVIRYFSSSVISNQKYDQLKSEVIETVEETGTTTLYEADEESETLISPKTADIGSENVTKSETWLETAEAETIVEEINEKQSCNLTEYINHNPGISVDHEKLKSMNNDYRGWLNIPDANVSYPVPQGKDNDYYLHKLFETQQYEYAGSLFIDAYSYKMENQDNLIIYGHNMKGGTMFGNLKNFKDQDFFESHPYIEFYTESENRVYLIFSVRTVRSNINSLDYQLDSFDLQDYIDKAIAGSDQYRDINLLTNGFDSNQYNQIITLSTCVGDASKRMIVNGIRIK